MNSRCAEGWFAASMFVLAVTATLCTSAAARGVSPYLPLNMAAQMERQIEQVLILADQPVMSRPIAAATVLEALPVACRADEALCRSVRRYLERYMSKIGVTLASVDVAASDGFAGSLPNQRGAPGDGSWQVAAQGYWQPSDHVLLSAGGLAHEDETLAVGSMLSVGFDVAQLDIGYRDHWFSPFTDSAMIISTQARTLPSITLSNYRRLSRFGVRYEMFLAEMAHSDQIRFKDGFTAGRPRLAGLHFSIEPASGWSLGINRMMQFGGGARGGRSMGDFFDALFKPSAADNRSATLDQEQEFGNQVAAWTSRFIFPGRIPFSVYMEYAGEDTSYASDYRLGNAALSLGFAFPSLWQRFDLTYEASEWQNGWYTHGIYGDGLSEAGDVLGHWGADSRLYRDAVGAQSHMLRLGWEPGFGGLLQLQARTIANQSYGSGEYERGYSIALAYSRAMRGFTTGVQFMAGRDVFGEDYGRLGGFVRFGDEWPEYQGAMRLEQPAGQAHAELFVDAGMNLNEVTIRMGDGSPKYTTSRELAPHAGIGARRAVSERSDLGVRLELDRIDDALLLAVRALDYRYRFRNPLALSLFAGAARYDLATPAYGYYLGAGIQWRDVLPRFDLGVDWRYADKVARDKLLPGDPGVEPRPDSFYDINSFSLSVSHRF